MQRKALASLVSLCLLAACPDGGGSTAGEDSTRGTTGIIDLTTGIGGSSGDAPTSTTDVPEPGSTSSGSTGEPEIFCDQYMAQIDPVIPRMVLVLDKSGSMISKGKVEEPGEVGDGFWDHDGDPNTPEITRWMSLHSVVESLLTGLDAVIQFGAVLFPSTSAISEYGAGACPVDPEPLVPIGPMQGASILAAIPAAGATDLAGGTPATAGMKVALSELQGLDTSEPRFIVLITDGAANCREDAANNTERFEQYDEGLPVVVAEAAAMGFPTYVIGIDILDVTSPMMTDGNPDNTNTFTRLNELAEAGGTARPGDEKFYNATNQGELQAALMEITKAIISCEIALEEPLPKSFYIQKVEVGSDGDPNQMSFEGVDEQVTDCASESGWMYTDPAVRDKIVLCGAACELYKETGQVQIQFGCEIG